MKEKVKLNEMEMFQRIKVNNSIELLKVPGGWICESWTSEGGTSVCFIPKSNEVGIEEYELI